MNNGAAEVEKGSGYRIRGKGTGKGGHDIGEWGQATGEGIRLHKMGSRGERKE